MELIISNGFVFPSLTEDIECTTHFKEPDEIFNAITSRRTHGGNNNILNSG